MPEVESDEVMSNPNQQNTDENNTQEESEGSSEFSAVIQNASDEISPRILVKKEYDSLIKQSQQKTGKVGNDDFSLIQVIGTGTYGKVLLVKKKDTGKLYAMKVLKKSKIKKLKQVQHTMTERKILEKINNPFIIKLNFAFQTQKKLFFVLDYCPGGELFFYISQIGRFKETSAKFYSANLVLAFECLHKHGIVYRE